MSLSSLSLLRVVKWFIEAKKISFISTTRAQYLTTLTLNWCNTTRGLFGWSMNCCTWPGAMFATFSISAIHDESCYTCNLTMSCNSTKSSGALNSGRPMSLIAWLILVHLLSQLAHFSWISHWGSWDIFTQYSTEFLIRSMLMSLCTRIPCSSVSRPFWTLLM